MGTSETLKALELVIERSDGGGPVAKALLRKKFQKAFREGRFREPDDPDWKFRICCAKLMMGIYEWDGWEYRDPWAQMLWLNPSAIGKPMWRGEPGRRVLILGEQGLGDEVMFASCIPEIQKTNHVGITVSTRLMSLFERNFGCPVYDRREGKELSRARELIPGYDCYIGIGDLPRILRRKASDFPGSPYLTAHPDRLQDVEPYRGKVGISWRGRNGFYPLRDFPAGISLQYDPAWDEEAEQPHIDVRNDMEGLVALISVLDKVVCVSTTAAHFAGAIGKSVDVITAPVQTARSKNQMNWRWTRGPTSPWYKCATIFPSLEQWKRSNKWA